MTDPIARFIAADVETDGAPLFRHDFRLDHDHGDLVAATLRLSALGICEAWINGAPVSADVLTPGWTSYEWRIHYVEHDVTDLIADLSTIGIAVGNGWWRGRLGWIETKRYGQEIGAYAELRLRFADGHEQFVVTDESWTVGSGATLSDDFYDGQHIDARRQSEAWKIPGYTNPGWGSVHVVDVDAELTEDPAPPVRRIYEIAPKKIWTGPSGSTLVDFGENIVGWLRVRVQGKAGDTITLRHSEVLEDGELAVRPLRTAGSTDVFTLSGRDDTFEPSFTFHGFRYAEVSGWPGGIDAIDTEALRAVVISSDLRRIGHFECSVPVLNQLHENIVRGMRGNFIDLPTDCPQRDERLGWTGDISAFAPTAAFLFDVEDFLADWLRDAALEQQHHGGILPYIVPDVLKYAVVPQGGAGASEIAAFWSDAGVWVPWALWRAYGNADVLRETFPSILVHGHRLASLLSPSGVWDTGFQFGDWLDPDAPAEHPGQAKADPRVVATACAYRTARTIRMTAEILGRQEEAVEFARLEGLIRDGFHREYVTGHRILSDCTTVYSLAIVFGLLEPDELDWAGDRLAELVAQSGFHISTGFAGTPFIADALTSTGHVSHAYRLLLQRECPSWLYPVTMGATTIWERWDSMLPDGTINPGDMTSFNHYALGAVADWMHRVVGGLAALEPGYRRILVAPQISDGIDWARTSLETPHGLVSVAWQRTGDEFALDVEIPVGASATVRWSGSADVELESGRHSLMIAVASHPELRAV